MTNYSYYSYYLSHLCVMYGMNIIYYDRNNMNKFFIKMDMKDRNNTNNMNNRQKGYKQEI